MWPGCEVLCHLPRRKCALEEGDDAEVDMFNWVSGYSVKFQGCHHIKQWNEAADGEEDVKISTSRLVRFRLCPSGSCSDSKAAGSRWYLCGDEPWRWRWG